MKVAYLGRYEEGEIISGPGNVARKIFEECCKANEAVFITYFFDGRKYSALKKLAAYEEVASQSGSRVIRAGLLRILRSLYSFKPDVIHIVNFERFAVAALLYKFLRRVKVIYTVHGVAAYEDRHFRNTDASYEARDRRIESLLFSRSDVIVFLSEQTLKIAEENYRIDRSKVKILPNGVEADFPVDGTRNFDQSELLIVSPGGEGRKEKRAAELAQALSSLGFPFKLFLLGSADEKAEGNIIHVKPMSKRGLAEFFSYRHIFISNSGYEPFSVTAVEAMSCGLVPVVTSDTGMNRYIRNGVNGYVFQSSDYGKLLRILSQLYADRKLLRDLSANAAGITEELCWENVFGMYKGVYG